MNRVAMNPAWTLRLHPGAAIGYPELSCAGDGDLDKVTLIASAPGTSNRIEVSAHDFLATVYVGLGEPLELTSLTAGKSEQKMTQRPGEVCIFGPRSTIVYSRSLNNQIIQYGLPEEAIRSLAAYWKLGQIDSLKSPMLSCDPVLHRLSRVMRHLLEEPRASRTTIGDQFARSFYFHLLQHYGVQSGTASEFSGGLSPRHKRIVDEAFSGQFHREIKIKSLASRCGLSAGHFARVFRQTFGRPFHQHVMKTRIHRAEELLRHSDLSLGEIARMVGYADQATFTESFTRATRVPPGRFRRQHIAAQGTRIARRSTRTEIVSGPLALL